jgi:hypothetical protein
MRLFLFVRAAVATVTLLFAGCEDGASGKRVSADDADSADQVESDASADDDAGQGEPRDASLDSEAEASGRASHAGSESGQTTLPALTCTQSFTLGSAELPQELIRCTEIVGNLIVQGKLPGASIALPNLRKLSGDLTFEVEAVRASFSAPLLERVDKSIDFIAGSKADRLELPLLKSIGGRLYAYGALLTELSLPALETITGALHMQSNRLKQLQLPKLSRADKIYVAIETDLVELSLPQLASVELGIEINGNDRLTRLRLESLTELVDDFAARLIVKENPLLSEITLPKLRRVADLALAENVALVSVQLPALDWIDSGLRVDDCLKLEELSLPRLTHASALTLRGNPRLASVSLLLLMGTSTIALSGNPALRLVSVSGLSAATTRATCDVMLGAWPCP